VLPVARVLHVAAAGLRVEVEVHLGEEGHRLEFREGAPVLELGRKAHRLPGPGPGLHLDRTGPAAAATQITVTEAHLQGPALHPVGMAIEDDTLRLRTSELEGEAIAARLLRFGERVLVDDGARVHHEDGVQVPVDSGVGLRAQVNGDEVQGAPTLRNQLAVKRGVPWVKGYPRANGLKMMKGTMRCEMVRMKGRRT